MNFHPFLKGWSFGSVNLRAAVKLSIRTGQDERFGGKMLHNLKPFFFFICLFLSFLRGLAACMGSTQSVSPFHHIRAYLTVKMCVIQKMVYNWPRQTLCPPLWLHHSFWGFLHVHFFNQSLKICCFLVFHCFYWSNCFSPPSLIAFKTLAMKRSVGLIIPSLWENSSWANMLAWLWLIQQTAQSVRGGAVAFYSFHVIFLLECVHSPCISVVSTIISLWAFKSNTIHQD